MLVRVSNIEAFRRYRESEDMTADDLVRWLTTDNPTPAMLAGTAFHAAIEVAADGEHETLEANGHTFLLPDAEIALPAVREIRTQKQYGDLTVTGCADLVIGRRVEDHKTTSRFDPERYLAGYQWRFYLDLFEADTFRWYVWQLREVAPMVFKVAPPEILEVHRYPGMERDCATLAADYLEFARVHLQIPPEVQ